MNDLAAHIRWGMVQWQVLKLTGDLTEARRAADKAEPVAASEQLLALNKLQCALNDAALTRLGEGK
jgi:hypothetical protein